jgi:two-component system, LytTR family, sensor kinase
MSLSSPSQRRWYWCFQITGWGLWCAAGLAMARHQLGTLNASVITGYALFFVYAIGLSHALRRLIKRRGWLALPPGRALGKFAVVIPATGLLLTAFVALVSFIQSGSSSGFAQPVALVSLVVNLTFGAGLWVTLYVSIATWLRNRQERQRADRLERSLAGARLKALEAQVSPHFLFNALNSLRGMIAENPTRAQDMVTRLANILRHNLTRGTNATTENLAEQLEIVSDYLELESVRFDERLRTRFDIDPASRACAVPSMVLQTLVENAIKHGIADRTGGGEVVISSRVTHGVLEVVVENSGTLGRSPANSTQVGLANARERLQMLYGPAGSLELLAGPNERVIARLRLPAQHHPGAALARSPLPDS